MILNSNGTWEGVIDICVVKGEGEMGVWLAGLKWTKVSLLFPFLSWSIHICTRLLNIALTWESVQNRPTTSLSLR